MCILVSLVSLVSFSLLSSSLTRLVSIRLTFFLPLASSSFISVAYLTFAVFLLIIQPAASTIILNVLLFRKLAFVDYPQIRRANLSTTKTLDSRTRKSINHQPTHRNTNHINGIALHCIAHEYSYVTRHRNMTQYSLNWPILSPSPTAASSLMFTLIRFYSILPFQK